MTTLEIILISILGYITICWIGLIIFSKIEKVVNTKEILVFIPFIVSVPLILHIQKIKCKRKARKRYKGWIND